MCKPSGYLIGIYLEEGSDVVGRVSSYLYQR
ncbi:hypothetical protein SAMN04490179_2403 [Pseudomonas antarctica]|uniref:Uncharacterized protein n=1 Tax=Pseudomonas antarctica TaxID=219572 RepID=A0A1G9YHW5_9PSED|nr:hypothetical protein PSAN_29900 [Pseudomonas antarctica]SDN08105.1 hypothetical protein SAMN04490179_2403 [Pseudomonas antarctica]